MEGALLGKLACLHMASGSLIAKLLDMKPQEGYIQNLEWKAHDYDALFYDFTNLRLQFQNS